MSKGKTRGHTSPGEVSRALKEALSHHQNGRLAEAEAAYRAVLKLDARNADALHLLGVAVLQMGRAGEAAALIGDAIRHDASAAAYHDNHGTALAAAGQPAEAVEAHLRALRLKPDFEQARFNLGNVLLTLGDDRAEAAFTKALALKPDYAKAWYNLGNLYRRRKNLAQATPAFAHTVTLVPGMAEAHNNLGDVLAMQKRLDEAVIHLRAVIHINRHDAKGWYNLGAVLQQRASYEEAEIAYRQALKHEPTHFGALNNLGTVLRCLGRPDQAEICHRESLRFCPDFAEALYNLGNALHLQGKFREAVECYEKALEKKPDLATATFRLGEVALLHGDLDRGWTGVEQRFDAHATRPDRRINAPRWQGGPVKGRLLVWREQGVGDEFLFSSCYGELAGHLEQPPIIETDRRLVRLFRRSFPNAEIRAETIDGDERETIVPPDCGAHIPAGSLPRLLRRRLTSFPSNSRWLVPDPRLVAEWRIQINRLPPGIKIGISWKSQVTNAERCRDYIDLVHWESLFGVPGLVPINLQYGDAENEIRAVEDRFRFTLHRWPHLDLKDDFENVAALIANLDLVITVGTAVGELAGALGTPVWRICGPDWTTLGTACRPWYPAMKVRFPKAGETLVDELKCAIHALRDMLPSGLPDPALADIALDRGVTLHKAGRLDEAADAYRQALAVWPNHADARHLLGVTEHQGGRSREALESIRAALAVDPEFPQAWNNLGLVLEALRRDEEAEEAFAMALVLRPDFADAVTHIGLVRQRRKALADAERWQRRAVSLVCDAAKYRTNLGSAVEQTGRFADAEKIYRIALALNPTFADPLNNLGNVARLRGDVTATERWMRRALRIDSSYALAAWNIGLIDLSCGRFDEGWAGYERRFQAPQLQRGRNLPIPQWKGERLAGERLLVWNEQGLGDEILFSSCLSDLEGLKAQVVIECDRRLVPLLARSVPWAEVRSESPKTVDCDRHIAMGSLPALFRRSLAAFPSKRGAWLHPDPVLARQWRERVDSLPSGLKVGIGWRSEISDAVRKTSYTMLSEWIPVLTAPGVTVVNLQYDDCAAEIAAVEAVTNTTVHVWPDLDLRNDLSSVAALISALDLVIVVPTAAGELAGGLGVPVWRICSPDWTWLGSATRPWYPTTRPWPPNVGEGLSDVLVRMGRTLGRRA